MPLPYNVKRKRPYEVQKGRKCKNGFCNRLAKQKGYCIRCYTHLKMNYKSYKDDKK